MEDRHVEARQLAIPGSNSMQCQDFKYRDSKGTPSMAAYHNFSGPQHKGEAACLRGMCGEGQLGYDITQ